MEKWPAKLTGLEACVSELGLEWPVSFWVTPQANTCRIHTSLTERVHEVLLNRSAAEDVNSWIPELLHELCHGALAERLDLAFSTGTFTAEYTGLEDAALTKFERQAQALLLATRHVDVWVDELRFCHWPEYAALEADRFSHQMALLAAAGEWKTLRQPEIRIAFAIHLAEERRFALPKSGMDRLGDEIHWSVEALATIFTRMPALPATRLEALAVLEQSTVEVVDTLKLGIKPQLVDLGDRAAWRFL